MSENEQIIRDYFQAINDKNYHIIHDLVHKDYRSETRSILSFQRALSLSLTNYSNNDINQGPNSLIKRLKFLFEGLSEFNIEIKNILSQESEIWVDFDIFGKHEGNLFGISPTHKKIRYRGIGIFKMKDNQIFSSDILFDWYGLFYQLRGYVISEREVEVVEEYLLTLNKLGLFVNKENF